MKRARKANIGNLGYNHPMGNDVPHPGGRPSKRTPETETRILDGVAKGLPLKAAAALAGVGETTLHDWRRADPAFDQAVARAEALSIAEHAETIRGASKSDWKASSWWLERRHADLFAPPAVQFHQQVHVS